jgi:exodeoxyribonuclease V alpha subunit
MSYYIDVHKVFAEYFRGHEALAYALSCKLSEGNICFDLENYKRDLPGLLEEQKAKESFSGDDARFWVSPVEFDKQCMAGNFVTHSDKELRPFVIQNGKAYLHRYFQYETQIIQNIRRLGNNFHIITGGPGTGKTYGVSEKLAEMFSKNSRLKVALAAPTGKAAARMNEAVKNFTEKSEKDIPREIKDLLTGLKAQTIHRLLGRIPDSVFFRYDADRKLPYNLIIIDECSMVDGALMAKLLNAIDTGVELYLLGDKDQLASVEAGSVFGDLCRCADSDLLKGRVEIKAKSWRFDKDKGIGKFSREVISGSFREIGSYDADEQIRIDIEYSEDLFRASALKYLSYIRQTDIKTALKELNRIRFLCVTREHDHSVAETNKKIERLLKLEIGDPSIFDPGEGCYHNQPVIITQNDYTLGVFNGDVGLIRREGNVLFAYFENTDGEIKKIQAGYLNHYDTVFAMTIHKSQGSEFDQVVLILPEKQGEKLLTRELLYTGVTRAKENVLIQSKEEVLISCAKRSVARASGLQERLSKGE